MHTSSNFDMSLICMIPGTHLLNVIFIHYWVSQPEWNIHRLMHVFVKVVNGIFREHHLKRDFTFAYIFTKCARYMMSSWQGNTFHTSVPLCGKPPAIGGTRHKGPIMSKLYIFLVVSVDMLLKQTIEWFETLIVSWCQLEWKTFSIQMPVPYIYGTLNVSSLYLRMP